MSLAGTVALFSGALAGLGVAAAAEASFLSVHDDRIRHRAEAGDRKARFLARHRADPQRMLATLLLASKVAVALFALGLARLLAASGADLARAGVWVVLAAAVVLVACQRVPGLLGAVFADRLAPRLLWPLRVLEWPPLSWGLALVGFSVRGAGRLLGMPQAGLEPGVRLERMRLLLEASEDRGVLDPRSHAMLKAVLEMGRIPVRQVMVPLEECVATRADRSAREAATQAVETGFSRLPTFAETPQHLEGYVHVVDLLQAAARAPETPVRRISRELLRLPPDESLVTALRLFRSSRFHMAAVVDPASGRALGLITIEDVLEQIVGESGVDPEASRPPLASTIPPQPAPGAE